MPQHFALTRHISELETVAEGDLGANAAGPLSSPQHHVSLALIGTLPLPRAQDASLAPFVTYPLPGDPVKRLKPLTHFDSGTEFFGSAQLSTSTSTSASSVVIGATESKTHSAHGTVVETSFTNITLSSSDVQRLAPVPLQPSIQVVVSGKSTTTTIGSGVSGTKVTVEKNESANHHHQDVTVHVSIEGRSTSTSSTETSAMVGNGKTHSFGLSAGVDVSIGIGASGSLSRGSSTQIKSGTKLSSDSHSTTIHGSFRSGTHIQTWQIHREYTRRE
ncbi:hypothetical protein M407DRAFT_29831 [Tulasnella calospora MUT 4182]|uniref:Uncharacterized protein n=1 Tax=Tulasnella calospora MUT 4182 TaxID=1051891 RepID=A0A0C3PYS1_9AGAM|nr:hypothetical protein M407DRAFT_29831 [Tulasnella calospora MUT 4182]